MLSFWRSGNEEKDEHFHLNILNWREAELEVLQRGKKKKNAWHKNPTLPWVPQAGHIPRYEAECGSK